MEKVSDWWGWAARSTAISILMLINPHCHQRLDQPTRNPVAPHLEVIKHGER